MKEKIYLIPGFMTDERLWSRLMPILEDEYELVHLPIPPSEDFDVIVDYLNSIITEDKISILGFSLGGYIASYFTLKFPQKVTRVFVVAVTPSATSQKDEIKRKEKLEIIKTNGFEPLSYEKAQSLLEPKNQQDEELIHIVRNMYWDLGLDTFITQMNSTFNRVDLFDRLNNLNKPVKFFISNNDRLLNKEALDKLVNEKHNMRVVVREGTSHNIPLEEPQELSKLIRTWMKLS